MLSTGKTGRAVAVVCGGSHDGTTIRVLPNASPDAEVPRRDLHEVLDEGDLVEDPTRYRLMPLAQRLQLAEAIARGDFDEESDEEERKRPAAARAPRRVARTYLEKSRYEYRLDDGKMIVLPSQETERVFVGGKSGAGKSWWTACYMREYLEMFPGRRVYLFSTHEGEAAYALIEHEAIALDEDFAEHLPGLENLQGSLCVFDDCDALTDKKVAKACDALNLNLINNGRKYDIHVVTLAHQLMEYRRTRAQLQEANRVVFFPQGSAYHNTRFLKIYGGLEQAWVKKILAERSRWVCLDLRIPHSYVTENAVVVIR